MKTLEANLSALFLSLAASAMIGLGLEPNPQTGKIEKNKDVAKFNIDLLILLNERMRGNLTLSESDLLVKLISDLQAKFIRT